MRVIVDLEACVGHGKCYLVAPNLFEPMEEDELGRPRALIDEVDEADTETVAKLRIVAANCPEGAIKLVGDAQ